MMMQEITERERVKQILEEAEFTIGDTGMGLEGRWDLLAFGPSGRTYEMSSLKEAEQAIDKEADYKADAGRFRGPIR